MVNPANGDRFFYQIGASALIEGTRAGLGAQPEGQRGIEVRIQDLSHDIAAVKEISAMYIDHLQMVRVDRAWKIVNVLWVPNPEAPRRGD